MISKLLENIRTEISRIKNIQSCFVYPEARCDVNAPAVFLEVGNYSHGDDPATEELALVATIEARVVVDSLIDNAEVMCQELACQVANAAHLNSFGCNVSPAEITGISRDTFKPEFDNYVCWLIEWQHQFHVGDNVWLESGVPPHILHINRGAVYE